MALAQEALIRRESGDSDMARELAARALPLEIEAAGLIDETIESEPTRSILYQSAASLAFQAGEYSTAQRLVAKGLSGYPPPRAEQELKDLYEQINFESHLTVRDDPLTSAEMQLSISGDSVGYGRVSYSAFDDRMHAVISMIDRTLQRLTGEPYRRKRRATGASRSFTPLISAPRAGSFSITIEVVQQASGQHTFLTSGEQVIDEVVEGVRQVQDKQLDELKMHINNDDYFVHFIASAQQLAPDGERVKLVGLSTSKRQVAFTQPKESFAIPTALAPADKMLVTNEPFSNTLRGTLDEATARRDGKIGLITEEGRPVTLWVREGMDDVVRSYFLRPVEVRVRHVSGRIELEAITGIEE